jgi:hypothetical protein
VGFKLEVRRAAGEVRPAKHQAAEVRRAVHPAAGVRREVRQDAGGDALQSASGYGWRGQASGPSGGGCGVRRAVCRAAGFRREVHGAAGIWGQGVHRAARGGGRAGGA